MHSQLTLNLLAWGLPYFLLTWENIQSQNKGKFIISNNELGFSEIMKPWRDC